jgi:hypothetical protein
MSNTPQVLNFDLISCRGNNTVAKDGSLVVTVGTPVEGREKRRVKLIEGEK